jgi:hypothetical protein
MKTETDIQISNLRASLKGEVIGSDDPRYDDARRVFFTGFDRRPAAIVRVGDVSDVARVVTLARETGAEKLTIRKPTVHASHRPLSRHSSCCSSLGGPSTLPGQRRRREAQ